MLKELRTTKMEHELREQGELRGKIEGFSLVWSVRGKFGTQTNQ